MVLDAVVRRRFSLLLVMVGICLASHHRFQVLFLHQRRSFGFSPDRSFAFLVLLRSELPGVDRICSSSLLNRSDRDLICSLGFYLGISKSMFTLHRRIRKKGYEAPEPYTCEVNSTSLGEELVIEGVFNISLSKALQKKTFLQILV